MFVRTAPLLVRELQSSGAEQFSHGAVLFLEVVDHVALLLVDPTRERDEHESERGESNHGAQATRRWSSPGTCRPIQESKPLRNSSV